MMDGMGTEGRQTRHRTEMLLGGAFCPVTFPARRHLEIEMRIGQAAHLALPPHVSTGRPPQDYFR